MLLVAFLQASNCSNYTGSWRHPDTDPGFLDLEFYQGIAKTLERGKFHLAFIDDRLAMPSRFGDSFEDAVEHGIRVVKLDLVPIMTAMGLATKHLGLGGTYSTTYYSPFHVARLFPSLDHFPNGRAACIVVTSLNDSDNDSEAQNFGVREHLKHDDRYDVAEISCRRPRSCGTPGRTERCCWTNRPAGSPTPPRSTGSITREGGSRYGGRRPCRGRPRGIRS